MIRSLARRSASVLVAAALVGGAAIGTGTATAQEAPATGSSADSLATALLFFPGVAALALGQATGSVSEDAPLMDCYRVLGGPDRPIDQENRCRGGAAVILGLILTAGSS